jgi:hypothetical protein
VLSVGRVAAQARSTGETLDVRFANGRDQGPTGIVSVTIAVTPDQANVVKAVMGQGDMSLALRSDTGDGASAAPNKYTLESVLGLSAKQQGFDRLEIFRGGWGRQMVHYQNAQIVRNDTSLIPGLAPSTPFPVPATIPAAPKDTKVDDKSTRPTPNFYHNGGFGGYGGYGGGFGGYGGGWGWGGDTGAGRD